MTSKQTVYLLQRTAKPEERYVGITSNLKRRLAEHNSGRSPHTSKFRDWKLRAAIWFEDEDRALDFERYLKTGSGRAFANRHFWCA
ncbi:MAG: GIY-YIG nuclease family protein [Vicinamibacteria bacterium]